MWSTFNCYQFLLISKANKRKLFKNRCLFINSKTYSCKFSILQAGEGRTTFVIAHRLSTVRDADMIVAVKDGAVAEIGTHDELMEKDGVYKELVTIQVA